MYDILKMKDVAKYLNNRTYTDYFYRLMLLARAVFKWENLPNNINEKWIEKYLFYHGDCMFYNDKTKGLMVARCTKEGLNHYEEPITLRPVVNGAADMSAYDNDTECVLIMNNDACIPTLPTIELYAYRLAEISRTIDTNIKLQKTSTLIRCSDKQRLSLKNVYDQWSGNEPVIWGDKALDTSDTFEAISTEAPIVFDKLQIQKHSIWNECMTFLGVNNANMDKRERLVDDEVQANNEQIELSANVFLKAREEACERINKVFGTSIKVSMRNLAQIKAYLEGSEEDLNDSEGSDKGEVA